MLSHVFESVPRLAHRVGGGWRKQIGIALADGVTGNIPLVATEKLILLSKGLRGKGGFHGEHKKKAPQRGASVTGVMSDRWVS